MRDHLSNAFYGVLDYLAWPAGMLVVAPVAIRTLGVDRYGIWVVAGSVISTGAIVASGFADANTRFVAMQRASGNLDAQRRSVRSSMGIHLALGAALALAGVLLAQAMTDRLVGPHSPLRYDCVWSLRLACLILLMRALETVCISTQRAFERYGAAVRLSLLGRMVSLAAVAVLPLLRPSVADILVATAVISMGSLGLQLASLTRLLHASCLPPRMDRETTRALLGFGKFTWTQAVSALLVGQADRLITGAALGAAAVTSYAICVQLVQPVYGITAAGLHFLFPRISAQFAGGDEPGLQRSVRAAVLVNWAAVATGTAVLRFFGAAMLRMWAGPALAPASASILPIVLYSTALTALAIAGMYAMLALGRPRVVTWLNVAGAAVMLFAVWWLLPRYGVRGMALARLAYGPICLGVYVPLFMQIRRKAASAPGRETRAALCEEAQ